ncbi:MAG: type IV pilus modification PilV family protein, partial [Nannocystaceae bacterium]
MRTADKRRSAGFSLLEVMMALVVFVVAVVGMSAMQSRGIEAQRAATEIREAERVGQSVMSELTARGFTDLIATDFSGSAALPPYSDNSTTRMLSDFRGPPVDDPLNVNRPGVREQFFSVYRSVLPIPETAATAVELVGVQLVVQVMWVDTTASNAPPPATARASTLVPDNIDPANGN